MPSAARAAYPLPPVTPISSGCYAMAAITIYVVLNLVNSTYGRGFLTVRDDEIAAEAMGINTTKYKVLAFTLAAFFAGIAGGLYAHLKQFINPEGFNFLKSVDIVTMVILGGMGSTGGCRSCRHSSHHPPRGLRASPSQPVLPHWLAPLLANRMIPYSLLLILLMLTRPQGLFGGIVPETEKSMSDPEPLLDLRDVTVQFGGLKAVSGFNFCIRHGELVGLIGPNGAGKTTIFNLITGVYRPTSGGILFEGKSVGGKKPYLITKRGIARTFQNIRLFASMSVFDNVRAAFNMHLRHGISHALWRGKGLAAEEARIEREAGELLEIFHLRRTSATPPARASPMATSVASRSSARWPRSPKLILLDEPAAGMNPTEKTELMELIRFVQEKFEIAVLLVEHDMRVVMGICQRIAVVDYGVKIAEGLRERD